MRLTTSVGERRALVIGSLCDRLPNLPLSFLPELAQSLFDVLTDHEICAISTQPR